MCEHQLKDLFYNRDEKYFSRHTCKKQNLVTAISKDVSEDDVDVPHYEDLPQAYDHIVDDYSCMRNPPGHRLIDST
jgi:hypothetical protein